jgi:flagellar motor switch protein FliG
MKSSSNFRFEHIVLLSNRDFIRLLNEIDNFTLICACQKCEAFIVERIVIQFCERGRNNFYDDLYKNANVTENQIFSAQERIRKLFSYLYFNKKFKDWKTNCAN